MLIFLCDRVQFWRQQSTALNHTVSIVYKWKLLMGQVGGMIITKKNGTWTPRLSLFILSNFRKHFQSKGGHQNPGGFSSWPGQLHSRAKRAGQGVAAKLGSATCSKWSYYGTCKAHTSTEYIPDGIVRSIELTSDAIDTMTNPFFNSLLQLKRLSHNDGEQHLDGEQARWWKSH